MLPDLIKQRIKQHGPISVAEYMSLALAHPEHGYYIRKDPLGVQGDFITAPEISQIFGELTGLWLAQQWRLLGRPEAALIELGPGRGTLMADIVRATKTVDGFHDAISIHLVEMSPVLQQKQWQALATKHPRLEWHATMDALPMDKPWLLIANEFFDALPIRQFVHAGSWKERRITVNAEDALEFMLVDALAPSSLPQTELVMSEYCEEGENTIRRISKHIREKRGAALIIDYGYSGGTRGDTLQAVKAHNFHDVLSEPGTADLTAHVDFDALKRAAIAEQVMAYGPTPQGTFLDALGAMTRAAKLCENSTVEQKTSIVWGLERLLSKDQMGDLFKALCIVATGHPKPEGF
jgi:NADH dehydrogenase [ubiquinone] 1 alpha subcomplex assembly factor 7